jgi:hypothetical protein
VTFTLAEVVRSAEFGWPGGDVPGELDFSHSLDPQLAAIFQDALTPYLGRFDASALKALTPPNGVFGRFSLALPDRNYFLRITADWGHPALEQEITAWLDNHQVPVNRIEFSGIPIEFEGERFRLDLRPLIAGRHFDGSPDDLRALAEVLGRCHAVLRDFPKAGQVQTFSAARFERLSVVRAQMREAFQRQDWRFFARDDWAVTHREWLDRLLHEFEPRLDLLPHAQCLHSQVHRANVLFTNGHSPILVDFEEAVHTFAPVSFDLAYFVQRFCLHDNPSASESAARLQMVKKAYGAPMFGVARMMQQTAWFSAVILVECHSRGVISPRSEYDKFVRLETQARELAVMIDG